MRIVAFDIAKAIGIILMVIGHTECPNWLHSLIYSFHMPLFFFVSGACMQLKDRNSTQLRHYVSQKFKKLYCPFVGYGLFFMLVSVLFEYFNKGMWNTQNLIYDASLIFAMIHTPELVAGYWFIAQLLIVSVMSYSILNLLGKVEKDTVAYIFTLLLFVITVFYIFDLHISTLLSYKTFIYMAIYLTGYYAKGKIQKLKQMKTIMFPVAIILFAVSYYLYEIVGTRITLTNWYGCLLYYLMAMSGINATLIVCFVIEQFFPSFCCALTMVGLNTLEILTWHFSMFKIVTIALIFCLGLSYDRLSEFPTMSLGSGYWLLYAIFAIPMSILMGRLITFVRSKNPLTLYKA